MDYFTNAGLWGMWWSQYHTHISHGDILILSHPPTSAAPALNTAFQSVASRRVNSMKANDTSPTFVSDIDLSIIPSTITRQPDGSHKVQLSLNGILTASTNDLPKDLKDEEIRELVSNGSIEVRLFNRSNL